MAASFVRGRVNGKERSRRCPMPTVAETFLALKTSVGLMAPAGHRVDIDRIIATSSGARLDGMRHASLCRHVAATMTPEVLHRAFNELPAG